MFKSTDGAEKMVAFIWLTIMMSTTIYVAPTVKDFVGLTLATVSHVHLDVYGVFVCDEVWTGGDCSVGKTAGKLLSTMCFRLRMLRTHSKDLCHVHIQRCLERI